MISRIQYFIKKIWWAVKIVAVPKMQEILESNGMFNELCGRKGFY
jgi:hypothetical protein